MRNLMLLLVLAGFGLAAADPEFGIVHTEPGRFGGWPANHGVWSWGNEILVGFELGYFKDNPTGHDIDRSKPAEHVMARSMDGGRTWKLERPEGLRPPPGARIANVPAGEQGRAPVVCPGGLDFTHPDFRHHLPHDRHSRRRVALLPFLRPRPNLARTV
jgi:hypothetical protein